MVQGGMTGAVGLPCTAVPGTGVVHVGTVLGDAVSAAGSVLTVATLNMVTLLRWQRQTVHPAVCLVSVTLCLLELGPLLGEWLCLMLTMCHSSW